MTNASRAASTDGGDARRASELGIDVSSIRRHRKRFYELSLPHMCRYGALSIFLLPGGAEFKLHEKHNKQLYLLEFLPYHARVVHVSNQMQAYVSRPWGDMSLHNLSEEHCDAEKIDREK